MPTNLEAVRAALAAVEDPHTGRPALAEGLIRGLALRDGRVGFVVEADAPHPQEALEAIRTAAEAAARAVPGVTSVTAVLTAHRDAAAPTAAPGARPSQPPPRGVRVAPTALAEGAPRPAPGAARLALPGVERIVAVASGKGGVGKSTIAANLACALAARGLKVGLLDADVYGPSAPILMGLRGADPKIGGDKRLIAPVAHGVKVMSMGFLVEETAPMIWRGPMVMSALTQLLSDVAWAPLDILILDLPPGTGDAQLTIAQKAPLSGAVIVSTPQEVALADARRGVEMFRRTQIPIIGLLENMSAYTDPVTGAVFAPFGRGGAEAAAAEIGTPFLGEIPLDPNLAALSDAGTPPGRDPQSPLGARFALLAELVTSALASPLGKPAPSIRFV